MKIMVNKNTRGSYEITPDNLVETSTALVKDITEMKEEGLFKKQPEDIDDFQPVNPVKYSKSYLQLCAIKDFLIEKFELRRNLRNNKIEFRLNKLKHEETDSQYFDFTEKELNSFIIELHKTVEFKVSKDDVRMILSSDFVKDFDIVHKVISKLKHVEDSNDYIRELFGCFEFPNSENYYKFFKKWFLGFVGSLAKPDIYNELVLLLKGKQGIGKTRILRSFLLPEFSSLCYEGVFNPQSKDHERLLAEKILIVMDEFDLKSDKQLDAIKSLTSRKIITNRKPYSINYEDTKRIASFCGTTNRERVLNDETASRRFIVLEIEKINIEGLQFLEKAYAQALYELNNGATHYLSQEEILEINEFNKEHTVINSYEEILLRYFRPVNAGEVKDASLTATQITEKLCVESKLVFSNTLVNKMGSILKQNGFVSRKSNNRKVIDVKFLTY